MYCEFIIIIQLGFLNSHILSTDGSNCETLSERTDHLCLYRKLVSSLPLPLKANRWNCSYVHRQLAYLFAYRTHSHAVKYACVSEACSLLLIFSDEDCRERAKEAAILVKATGAFKCLLVSTVATQQQSWVQIQVVGFPLP